MAGEIFLRLFQFIVWIALGIGFIKIDITLGAIYFVVSVLIYFFNQEMDEQKHKDQNKINELEKYFKIANEQRSKEEIRRVEHYENFKKDMDKIIQTKELEKLVDIGIKKNKLKKYLIDYFAFKHHYENYEVCYNCQTYIYKDKNIATNGWGLPTNYCNECVNERMSQIKGKSF